MPSPRGRTRHPLEAVADAPSLEGRRGGKTEVADPRRLVGCARVHSDTVLGLEGSKALPEALALAIPEVTNRDEEVMIVGVGLSLDGRGQRIGAERVEIEKCLVGKDPCHGDGQPLKADLDIPAAHNRHTAHRTPRRVTAARNGQALAAVCRSALTTST